MKLQLKDRVVVEFLASENEECFTPDFIAGQLRAIADSIQAGQSGDIYIPWTANEVLWEHESTGYGGFRILSGKSLISQYYYNSEVRPIVIDRETIAKIVEWRKMIYEKEGDDMKYTDGELNEDAEVIMDSIIDQWKEQSK